jgi:hypothetical protein
MRIRLAAFARHVACWAAGLLSIPLGLFTFFLFCATGRPVPREFISNSQPDFGLDLKAPSETDGIRRVAWLRSSDLRCDIGLTLPSGTQPHQLSISEPLTATVFDHFTMEKLGTFPSSYEEIGAFTITPDRTCLLSIAKGKLQVRRLRGCEEASEECCEAIALKDERVWVTFEFSADGRQALIWCEITPIAFQYDIMKHRIVEVIKWPAAVRGLWFSPHLFFNSKGSSKVLLQNDVCDLASNGFDLHLQSHNQKGVCCEYMLKVNRAPVLATFFEEPRVFVMHSLDDGRLLQQYSIPPGLSGIYQFSSDGRFLIAVDERGESFVKLVNGWNGQIGALLGALFPERKRSALLELSTGKIWVDHLGEGRCAFTEDGTQMKSFTDAGYYLYDVPPKVRWFTPWAWPSLAASFALITLWWKLRKRPQGLQIAT